jgi:hypothetical protein
MTDNNLNAKSTADTEKEADSLRRQQRNFNIYGAITLVIMSVVFWFSDSLADRLYCGACIFSTACVVACLGGSLDRFRRKEKSDLDVPTNYGK